MKKTTTPPPLDDVKAAAAAADEAARSNYLVGPKAARPEYDELYGVPYKPPMIVDGYLQQDAGGDVGTGGTGKTTLLLWEAVHVILGRPLYGRNIARSGGVLIVTAEDSREITLSRLNQVCNALGLNKTEQDKVRKHFYVEDISATDAKLVVADRFGVHGTPLVEEIIEKYANLGLAFVSLDPTSLLGPGELSGNDGMAQLMRTARTLCKELGAAVRLVHHVGQQVSRSDIRDQYAGRGGSAFADNSRSQRQIVKTVARKFDYEGSKYELPSEISDFDIAKGNVLAIYVHKLSYAERDSKPIIVVRNGFAFRHVPMDRVDNSDAAKANRRENEMWRVVDYIRGQLLAGKKIGRTELEENTHIEALGLTRADLRTARDTALDMHAFEELELPKNERSTKRKKFLSPAGEPNPANPANPAESRRNHAGGIQAIGGTVAANPAAAVHAIAAAGFNKGKKATHDGDKQALPGRIPPSFAGRKKPNGRAVYDA